MDSLISVVFMIFGLAFLVGGAESLVRGASSLAANFKVSPLIIGLTIVAFGTSAPELTVNLISAFNGNVDIAIGNVIGSNIANILLILGVCALIKPLKIAVSTVWKEIPFAVLGVLLVMIMGNDARVDGYDINAITRSDGLLLLSMMIIFLYYTFGLARSETQDTGEDVKKYSYPISGGLVLAGLVGLVGGGKLLVDNAVSLALSAGVSESLVGLTVVAIGTSLPELATSIVAVRKGQVDIAVGNVVGSNIFNIFFVLATTSTILNLPFNTNVNFDVVVALAASTLLFLFMFVRGRHKLMRVEGITLLILYVVYTGFVALRG